jgi:LPXTG-motif cell wall-anchored protein
MKKYTVLGLLLALTAGVVYWKSKDRKYYG